ncbi:hypothetical protein [Ralstonia solanacearum]|uniref:hypothetical protein n=1 Tax=Ralstonia solanacearum TaxID=305 RepID=UPI0018D030FE|nr:hypothetical protein [Ralstonia solanacearum]MDC6209620.1 hypothetical protein [Ralstonia solanacearum]MDC6239513.1 hypothetical protein [Ralstonia solanacearum]MDD7799394.1 hypothetical protein [Ralstonia solanacearum]
MPSLAVVVPDIALAACGVDVRLGKGIEIVKTASPFLRRRQRAYLDPLVPVYTLE